MKINILPLRETICTLENIFWDNLPEKKTQNNTASSMPK